MTWKRSLIATALAAAGLAGVLTIEEIRARRTERAAALLNSTIGAPFCVPQRGGTRHDTFFRLAMAQPERGSTPARTEVGPFSRAIPGAVSAASADAEPVLADDLGTLHYRITTSLPLAQRFFDQGLRLAYAFNHAEALRAFRKARALDPECAMCYWGEALVLGPNINAPMDAASGPAAFAAITEAKALSTRASENERALIDALALRYPAKAGSDRGAHDTAYAAAMQAVAANHPDDDEIALQYAESLMDLQPWDYWAGDGTPKGRTAEIVTLIEHVLARSPDHPGAIHYYIHMVEASANPARALPHARRLGRLMPGAGHLVHMPFHIFFRAGLYKEALASNRQAVAADEAFIARAAPAGIYPDAYYPHNVHSLLVSAQMAGDGQTVIESARKLEAIVSDAAAQNIAWVQPIKAAPYFAHAQFSDARTILALPDPGSALPYVKAMWHYARAIAAAGAGEVTGARAEADEIERIGTTADFSGLEAGGVPAREVLQLAQHVARGRIARAQRDHDGAIAHYSAAIAVEDRLAYSEPPFWYYPTRQSLGAALLDAGKPERAEQVFRESLVRAPNNGWALFGLMKVYEQSGDRAGARAARDLLSRAWVGDPRVLRLERL